jgi:hypothetical protein
LAEAEKMKQKVLFFFLTGVMVLSLATSLSCTGKTSVTIENVGRWSYQFFNGYQSVPDYDQYSDPEGGFAEANTINTAQINGDGYLLMNFPALSGRINGRIFLFDTKDPLSPQFIASVAPAAQGKLPLIANSVAVTGSTVYAGLFGDKGLWIADIADPSSPIDLGVVPLEMTNNLVVSGNYVYGLSQMNYDMPIADVADTQNVREVARIDTKSRECRLAVSGDLLFVGSERTLTVYDVATPSSPIQLGTCDLALSGNLSTELPFPEPGVVHWTNWANILDMQTSGNYVYATFGAGGVRVIDVSDPTTPQEVAVIDISGFAIMMSMENDLLYITSSNATAPTLAMSVIDITHPKNPKIVGSVTTDTFFGFGGATVPHCFMRPQVIGDYVYIAGWNYMDVYRVH